MDPIELHVIERLEAEFASSTYAREQLDELDRFTEAWAIIRTMSGKPRRPRSRRKSPLLS